MTRIACVCLVCFALLSSTSCKERKGFRLVKSEESGITYKNTIQDNDSLNIISEENIYNGAGNGIADFNNDGLQDIFFSGNQVPNALYLNKGEFKFEDVSEAAGIKGKGQWGRGVAVVDINQDGLQDVYVCSTILNDSSKLANQLYVNQGNNKQGIPVFKDMAKAYGLDDLGHTTMAAFFDYDNDGDLDVYLLTNRIYKKAYPNTYAPVLRDGSHPNTDRFYKNIGSDSLGHPYYVNVSKEAGIQQEGYGHGINIVDINNDGWKDVYITNDYISSNLLWINNKNGTFTEKVKDYLDHSSANAMGVDIADINNDALPDILELDMNPEDNFRKRMFLNGNNYQNYVNSDQFGYQYQYVKNTLQLNRGQRVNGNDSLGDPVFSELGFLAGIAETDWSWTPLMIDLDNDGNRDVLITNGFPKDVTDHDFITYRNQSYSIASIGTLLEQIPQVRIPNYVYRNKGALQFEDKSKEWDMDLPAFSNAAAYGDFDNDGDLDLVINNINDHPFLYENKVNGKEDKANYLQVKLQGNKPNLEGFGAMVSIFSNGQVQYTEYTPYRGYLSTSQQMISYGLGKADKVDSLRIVWPNGKQQLLKDVKVNQVLTLKEADAADAAAVMPGVFANAPIIDITNNLGIPYVNDEQDFVDFNIQKLLPRKFSEQGPGIAAADMDGNGTDDIVLGGSLGKSATVLFQSPSGRFTRMDLMPDCDDRSKPWEETGVCLFDADGDGDNDIYTASGGYENIAGNKFYTDHLYINDGKGRFTRDTAAIPPSKISKSAVRALDIDRDGDQDLVVAGRLISWEYPSAASTVLLRNDSKQGKVVFTDVTSALAPGMKDLGLVSDVVVTDADNDGWQDLLMAGDWMPVTLFRNDKGKFSNTTAGSGLEQIKGWFTSILPGDFDHDGDMDYVVSNTGKNSFYRPTEKEPVKIFHGDFDNNGSYDAYLGVYLKDKIGAETKAMFPAHTREDMIKQMIQTRDRFKTYKDYAAAKAQDILTPEQLAKAKQMEVNSLAAYYVENKGKGRFEMRELPLEAQVAPAYGMQAEDVDGDGHLDIMMTGNDFGTDVSIGRYDALKGLVLKGNGKGSFRPMTIRESGFYTPGNCRGMIRIRSFDQQLLFIVAHNRGALQVKKLRTPGKLYGWQQGDQFATLKYKDGTARRVETVCGQSYLSQSSPFIYIDDNVSSLTITDMNGKERKLF